MSFQNVLRASEEVRRSAGVSAKYLMAAVLKLVVVVGVYWLFTRVLVVLTSGSSLAPGIIDIENVIFGLLTLFLALVALLSLLILVLKVIFVRYALTDSRVLQRSFLRTRGAELTQVQDIEVNQSLIGKLLGFGDVAVRTASADGALVFKNVDRPHEWFRALHESVRTEHMRQDTSG